jgi:hypothetical protein
MSLVAHTAAKVWLTLLLVSSFAVAALEEHPVEKSSSNERKSHLIGA